MLYVQYTLKTLNSLLPSTSYLAMKQPLSKQAIKPLLQPPLAFVLIVHTLFNFALSSQAETSQLQVVTPSSILQMVLLQHPWKREITTALVPMVQVNVLQQVH